MVSTKLTSLPLTTRVQDDVSDCLQCPGGMYCPNPGTVDPQTEGQSVTCPKGYYCPASSAVCILVSMETVIIL